MATYTITIMNWEKYNPRKDIARPWWFALNHDFFEDQKITDFSLEEKAAFIYILCQASKNYSERGKMTINTKHATVYMGISEPQAEELLNRTVKKLVKLRIVECRSVRGLYAICTPHNSTVHNSTVQDITLHNKEELKAPAVANADASTFISKYIKAHQGRYGGKSRPNLTGKVQGQIKNLLKSISIDRAINLVEVYYQMDDAWFITKCHDFTTFVENLQKIGIALDTGSCSQQKKGFDFSGVKYE